LLPVALLAALPALLGGLVGGGRDLTHLQLAYYSPALVLWIAVTAVAGCAIVGTRAAAALRRRPGTRLAAPAGR
jgi:hypothetical protein